MYPVKKVYAYILRYVEGEPQLLMLRPLDNPKGLQIPEQILKNQEDTYSTVIEVVKTKTGIDDFEMMSFVTDDVQKGDNGEIYHRFFYKIITPSWEEEGIEEEERGIYWVSRKEAISFQEGYGDYIFRIL
ncbi:hypothetical protein U0355_01510 [Salimicrobium sp. PL1-032A]|uniref:hypothetical protein n=1 Tax=Salimicrobium sp. PL1-032A TaxID=3095364 RepID=UPI003260D33D